MAVQTPERLAKAKRAADYLGITLPDTINSGQISGTTVTPKITPVKQNTANAGLLGAAQSSVDQFGATLKQQREDAQKNKETSLGEYTKQLFEGPTQSQVESEQYKKTGVDTIQSELDDINSQLMTEQHALQREIERIQDNAVGASMGQVGNMVQEVEAKSARKQADLSIIQMGIQGRYNTAKAIADRAVDAAMERQKNILEATRINYEDNKSMFTTAEQREFENLLTQNQREYDTERDSLKQISDMSILALQNGADSATVQAIRAAKTPGEAQGLAASFIGPIITREREMDINDRALDRQYKQAQIAGIGIENQKKLQELNQQVYGSGIAYSENGQQVSATEPPKQPTVSEQQSLVFFSRMKEAVDNMDAIESKIRGLGFLGQAQLNYLPSFLQNNEQQLYKQASRQFTEARLRKDSGAAIPEQEFVNDRKMYFPQPGDGPDVLEQKRQARNTALSAIRQSSGNAYWQLYGEPPTVVTRREQEEQKEYDELLKNATPEELELIKNQ